MAIGAMAGIFGGVMFMHFIHHGDLWSLAAALAVGRLFIPDQKEPT